MRRHIFQAVQFALRLFAGFFGQDGVGQLVGIFVPLKGSKILDTDPAVGAEFIAVLAAPLNFGQGGRPQVFPVYVVDLVDLCVAQTDK